MFEIPRATPSTSVKIMIYKPCAGKRQEITMTMNNS